MDTGKVLRWGAAVIWRFPTESLISLTLFPLRTSRQAFLTPQPCCQKVVPWAGSSAQQ